MGLPHIRSIPFQLWDLLDLWWSIILSSTAVPGIAEILLLSHADVS